MKIAIAGCAHGELDKIYESTKILESENSIKIDLLICCGDFQAVRNVSDLQCMAVPPKYRSMNTFYKYYKGDAVAPLLTIFIGGNHEASNYLSELPYGGWVAPKIFYLGLAGVVRLGNLRIAGVSGIFKDHDYLTGHFERPPYDANTLRSVYHVRNLEIFRLKQLQDVDVILSHDWPRGIHNFGDQNFLFRRKPYFKNEADENRLGSQPLRDLLDKVQPKFWFAAHMHVKFAALYINETNPDKITNFLALDKCLPHRQYLQILDLEGDDNSTSYCEQLSYDREWLAILKSTDFLVNAEKKIAYMPGPGSSQRFDFRPTETELSQIDELFKSNFIIPENFEPTAPPYDDSQPRKRKNNESPSGLCINPQTTQFCDKLSIRNLNLLLAYKNNSSVLGTGIPKPPVIAPDEPPKIRSRLILPPPKSTDVDSSEDFIPLSSNLVATKNPDEILLDEESFA